MQSRENPSLVQLETEAGQGRKSPFTGAWSAAKLDPNQAFFSNFPVKWTFQRIVAGGEGGQQGGLEADADLASSSMVSRLAGDAVHSPMGLGSQG